MTHNLEPSEPITELPSVETRNPYDSVFWFTYLANTTLMVSVGVLFRYADFVTYIGGQEFHLGLIVGIGTVGALAMRIIQGVGIDRYGPRLVWLASLVLFVVSMLAHLTITSVDNPAVYIVRILMMISMAGAFGASITFISLRAPEPRIAEMIGMLGTSGFLGMAMGPTLGDWLLAGGEATRLDIVQMFLLAAGACVASLVCAALATRGKIRLPKRRQPPAWRLLWRYHPGVLLLVASAMGLGIGFHGTFLRPYAKGLGIDGIKTFFLVYAATAFVVRVSTRRMHERCGPTPMILMGLSSLSISILLYMVVASEWMLVIPALAGGVAHAFLFPSVVGSGSTTFPARYRGLATTLMLAMFDVGVLFGQPLVGGLIKYSPRIGLPGYPTTFTAVSAVLLTIAVLYVALRRRRLPPENGRGATSVTLRRPASQPDSASTEVGSNVS